MDEFRKDIARKQKKGLPFMTASVVIWGLIVLVSLSGLPIMTRNLIVFCCSCPMLSLSWIIGKRIHVDIFSKENPLGQLGFLFTLNQMIYLLIVMWVFQAVPEKMVMVYAMVFGAHLLPYSRLYLSGAYRAAAVVIPMVFLILGTVTDSGALVAAAACLCDAGVSAALFIELKKMDAG